MVNKVVLIGRVGKTPEVKTFENDVKVASLSLATTEKYKDKSGEKQETITWHNVVLWRGLASVAENYIKKGDLLYVEGKITNKSYEADGVKKYRTDIVGNNIQMLGGKKENTPTEQQNNAEPKQDDKIEEPSEDLPF